MNKESRLEYSEDSTRELRVRIPDRLAERLETYAKQNKTEIAQVVIESIGFFLQNQSKDER